MLLRYNGWDDAADLVLNGEICYSTKQLTFDLARARAGKRIIRTKSKQKHTEQEVKENLQDLYLAPLWLLLLIW